MLLSLGKLSARAKESRELVIVNNGGSALRIKAVATKSPAITMKVPPEEIAVGKHASIPINIDASQLHAGAHTFRVTIDAVGIEGHKTILLTANVVSDAVARTN